MPKDFLKKVAERKAKIEESARRRAEDDAANAAGSTSGQQGDEEEGDSGMVEDLSVVGMGGAPIGGSDDSDDDSDSD